MTSLSVKIWMSVVLLFVGVYGVYKGVGLMRLANEPDYSRNLNLPPERPLDEFRFTERSGREVSLAELKGEIFIVNFFYATCPASCVRLNQTVAGLQQEFKNADVRFVSVTVDPTTDTPERLTTYAERFGADREKWWFLTAPLRETQELGRSLHVSVVGLGHTDDLVLVDRKGTIRGAYFFQDAGQMRDLREDLNKLLVEQPRESKPRPSATPSATSAPGTAPTSSKPAEKKA